MNINFNKTVPNRVNLVDVLEIRDRIIFDFYLGLSCTHAWDRGNHVEVQGTGVIVIMQW